MAFVLTLVQVLGTNTAILLSVKDYFDWTDGKKGDRLGTAYNVLALGGDPAILAVKVPDAAPAISQAELDAHNAARDFVEVTFEGFVGTPYSDRAGKMQLSCKAAAVELIDTVDFGVSK